MSDPAASLPPSAPRWAPSVTVAAVIESEGRYLLVEEHTPEGLRLNNPAGHLEPGETPLAAVVREALEETARCFEPQALLGIYLARFTRTGQDVTYLRIAFSGTVGDPLPGLVLDAAIQRTLWLTLDEIRAHGERHRSPLVQRCIEDHAAGQRLPLAALYSHPSVAAPIRLG